MYAIKSNIKFLQSYMKPICDIMMKEAEAVFRESSILLHLAFLPLTANVYSLLLLLFFPTMLYPLLVLRRFTMLAMFHRDTDA